MTNKILSLIFFITSTVLSLTLFFLMLLYRQTLLSYFERIPEKVLVRSIYQGKNWQIIREFTRIGSIELKFRHYNFLFRYCIKHANSQGFVYTTVCETLLQTIIHHIA